MRKAVSFVLLLGGHAFAYLDPGTGSAIAGSFWVVIVAFLSTVSAFFIRRFWVPIKRFLFGKKPEKS